MNDRSCAALAGLLLASSGSTVSGQVAASPDLRPAKLADLAIVGGDVVVRPGETIESATVLVEDGVVIGVGPSGEVEVPPGFRVVDATGLHVYPGLIDAGLQQSSADAAGAASKEAGAHWNAKVVPQIDSTRLSALSASQRKALGNWASPPRRRIRIAGSFEGAVRCGRLARIRRGAPRSRDDGGGVRARRRLGSCDLSRRLRRCGRAPSADALRCAVACRVRRAMGRGSIGPRAADSRRGARGARRRGRTRAAALHPHRLRTRDACCGRPGCGVRDRSRDQRVGPRVPPRRRGRGAGLPARGAADLPGSPKRRFPVAGRRDQPAQTC